MEGYGQALLSANSQTITSPILGSVTFSQPLNTTQELLVALGNVGNRFGQQLEPIFNRPPTVQVYSGTGVGILFTSDIKQPQNM